MGEKSVRCHIVRIVDREIGVLQNVKIVRSFHDCIVVKNLVRKVCANYGGQVYPIYGDCNLRRAAKRHSMRDTFYEIIGIPRPHPLRQSLHASEVATLPKSYFLRQRKFIPRSTSDPELDRLINSMYAESPNPPSWTLSVPETLGTTLYMGYYDGAVAEDNINNMDL